MSYTRRPILEGNTNSDELAQPHIVGSVSKDADSEFPSLSPQAELRIETESGPPISVQFGVAPFLTFDMSTIVDAINTQMLGQVEAEDRDGVLLLRTTGPASVGEGAYIRIHSAILGLPFVDASFVFGFPRYPDPLATVSAGDQGSSPPRTDHQENPVGTKLLAFGEDRVSSAYNRALQVMAKNADLLHLLLNRPIAIPEVIKIATGMPEGWETRLFSGGVLWTPGGPVDQVNLSGLIEFSGRRGFVGGLTRNSIYADIAEFFAIQDSAGKDILSGGATVQVAAVTQGLRTASVPNPPGTTLPDTLTPSDGGNALGVDRVKVAAIPITEVLFGTNVRCPGAQFVTKLVAAGDKAVIAGSTIDIPYNHNGEYIVEVVVSEEELVLRGADEASCRQLNDDGVLGTVVISTGGEFSSNLYVSFNPPIPSFPPATGALRLLLGFEKALGEIPPEALLEGMVKSSEEIDGLVQLWRLTHTLGGVYRGPNFRRGSGSYAPVTHQPFLAETTGTGAQVPGTLLRGGTGIVLSGDRLEVDLPDSFTEDDAGRVIKLSNGPTLEDEPFLIEFILDQKTAKLVPFSTGRHNTAIPTGTVDWEIFGDAFYDWPGTYGAAVGEPVPGAQGRGGFFYQRLYDGVDVSKVTPGQSFTHLEQVKLDITQAINRTKFPVTFDGVSSAVGLLFDPTLQSNIRPELTSNVYSSVTLRSGSLLRILNGTHAGWYRVLVTFSDSVPLAVNSVVVMNLDGSTPTFSVEPNIYASFYNVAAGSYAGHSGDNPFAWNLFHDSVDGPSGGCLSVDWRGSGYGIFGWLNDPDFYHYGNGDAARGPFIGALGYAPAKGIVLNFIGKEDDGVNLYTYAHDFSVKSWSVNWAVSPPTTIRGWSGRYFQGGKDPGLIVVKKPGATSPPSMAYVLEPAAYILRTQVGHSGRASALELSGSIWQERGHHLWDGGGIYTEEAIGAGKWLYPSKSHYSVDGEPYYGTGGFLGWEAPTALGNPGRIFPALTGDPSATLNIDPPDYDEFNFAHDAVMALPFMNEPYSRWVGIRVKVLDGTYVDEIYTVIGAKPGFAALRGGTPVASTELVEYEVYGERWHESYLSVADWMMIGTRFHRGHPEILPITTLGSYFLDLQARYPYSLDVTGPVWTGQMDTEGILSGVPATPQNYGVGVGEYLRLADMPNLSTVNIASYTNEWQTDAEEPRTPIPNVGVFMCGTQPSVNDPGPDDVLEDSNHIGKENEPSAVVDPGSLLVDDFALVYWPVNSLGTSGVGAYFSTRAGGCLKVTPRNTVELEPEDTYNIQLWLSGARNYPRKHHALRAQVIVDRHGIVEPITAYLRLYRSDGTMMASSSGITIPASLQAQEISQDFTESDLLEAAYDTLEDTTIRDQGIHLVLEWQTPNGVGVEDALILYVMRMTLDTVSKAERVVGDMEVWGSIAAHSYRFPQPVKGYQTLSPAGAELLSNAEYARNFGQYTSLSGPRNIPPQEHHDVGLVSTPPAPDPTENWYKPAFEMSPFFQKGRHSAALSLYHPYYDPLWYMKSVVGTDTFPALNRYVIPGKTGFFTPLDPPHGSKLTSLSLAMSFLPNITWDTGAGGPLSTFNIWRNLPLVAGAGDPLPANSSDWGDWLEYLRWASTDYEGYEIRIWRYNSLHFGVGMPPEPNVGPLNHLAQMGYAEEIFFKSVPLDSSSDAPGAGENAIPGAVILPASFASNEFFQSLAYNLLDENSDRSQLTVDRRHYSYAMTIEFWGGMRVYQNPSGLVGYDRSLFDGRSYMPREVTAGGEGNFKGFEVIYPYGEDLLGHQQEPVVKFRGARLGWVTDRAGNGGW